MKRIFLQLLFVELALFGSELAAQNRLPNRLNSLFERRWIAPTLPVLRTLCNPPANTVRFSFDHTDRLADKFSKSSRPLNFFTAHIDLLKCEPGKLVGDSQIQSNRRCTKVGS